jgi:hypothetical protein
MGDSGVRGILIYCANARHHNMPPTRKYTAWGSRRRAALANMVIPREQQ